MNPYLPYFQPFVKQKPTLKKIGFLETQAKNKLTALCLLRSICSNTTIRSICGIVKRNLLRIRCLRLHNFLSWFFIRHFFLPLFFKVQHCTFLSQKTYSRKQQNGAILRFFERFYISDIVCCKKILS